MKIVAYLLAAGLISTGCAGSKNSHPVEDMNSPLGTAGMTPATNSHQTTLIVTPAASPNGKVVRVNESARFAVLNFPIGNVPPVGQRLDVYRKGLKVGEIKVTGPQQDDNTVADIVNGEAEVGDELRVK